MKRLSLLALPLVLQPASAQVVPHGTYLTAPFGPGGTWNLYQTNNIPATWTDAQAQAEAKVDPLGGSGKKGHLVCIGSAAENQFVYEKVLGRFIWLGLTDNEKWGGKEAGSNRKGEWRWVNGEPLTYAAWRSPEPNAFNAGGEDCVSMEYSARWADFPNGADGEEAVRFPSMTEWDVQSDKPIPGAVKIGPVMPAKWPVDLLESKNPAQGKGPWVVTSFTGRSAQSLSNVMSNLQAVTPEAVKLHRIPRLNYNVNLDKFYGGGWVEITDHPVFPFMDGNSGALHMAKIRLEKPDTWSFNVHCDDFVAVRIRGQKWKNVTGLGGVDPQDPTVMYFACESGDGCMVGSVDLPAGESVIEVVLGNRMFDGMVQLLAAPGEVTMEGGTDQWRFPGHKAAGDLAWPGVDSAGWTVSRTDRPASSPRIKNLMEGLPLAESDAAKKVEGVEKINYIDSGAAGDIEFPDPAEFPGDEPGNQDQFVVKATGNLVIPRDGVYHIGIHAEDHCALRIVGQKWLRFVRDTGYCGKLEDDTIYGAGPMFMGTNIQLLGEIKLAKGTYKMEALYVDVEGPSTFSVFAAPAGFAPRLLAKDGAKIEPDINGLPLAE